MAAPARAIAAAPAFGRLPGLTVVVPAHDEAASIVAVCEGLLAVLPRVAVRAELVVVDDGSRDETATLVRALARRSPAVRVVQHPRNRGYGAAVRSGIEAACHPWLFYIDGDGQFDAIELERAVAALGEADAVVGYRVERAEGGMRRLNGACWNALVGLVFGLPERDVNCAVKLFRASALGTGRLQAEGAMISTEILARLHRRGAIIVEMPVTHRPRRAGAPSGARPGVIARAFTELMPVRRGLLAVVREPD